jgi:hypothetical protein
VLLFALFVFHSAAVAQTSFDDFRTVAGSYYNLEGGYTSTLTLNNKGTLPLQVNPTVFSLNGTQLELPPITVPATSFIDVNLQTMLGNAGNEFGKGSIKLCYFGMQIQLGAQITIKDAAKSISLEEKLLETGSYNSQWLEGVWYQPSSDAKVKIFLSNTSDQTLNLIARLSRMPRKQGQIETIELLPHQTKVLDLKQDFSDGQQFANHRLLGFSVKQSGAMDALIARVTVSEEATGYSNVTPLSEAIPISLPILSQSKSLHGTGLQLEKIGNEKLEPKIAVRNIGTANTIVKAKIFYTLKNGQKGNVVLPNLNLDSLEMRFFDAQNAIDLADSSQIESAGIEITHNGGPGTIIAKVESVSTTRNHSFRVLLWEPVKTKRAASSYPWNLSGNNQTKVYLKNTTDQEQQFTSYLTYNSGTKYVLSTNKIAPHQVKVIDVKKVRDSQLPDANGNTLPLNIEQGQIEWSLAPKINQVIGQTGAEIIGQASQINAADKTSSVYFCINICVDSSRIEFLDQNVELEIGDSAQLRFVRINTTAYGDNVTYPDPNSYTWISQDNSVAQVFPGTVVANSVGETQINVSGAGATSIELDTCSQYYSLYSSEWINDPYIIQQLQQTLGCRYCEAIYASVDASTNVIIKPSIKILRNGQDITSTQQNANVQTVTIGEKISLTAAVSGGNVTDKQWSLPSDKAIKNYEVICTGSTGQNGGIRCSNPTSATKTELSSQDLSQSTLNFFWWKGGNDVLVQLTIIVNGTSYTTQAKFNVLSPSSIITAPPQPPTNEIRGVIFVEQTNGIWRLIHGEDFPLPSGIRLKHQTTFPNGVSGQTQWVQTYNLNHRFQNLNGTWSKAKREGIDVTYPYPPNTPQLPNQMTDSPGQQLSGVSVNNVLQNWKRVEVADSANTWVMFKSSTADSIWVPLAAVNWGWNAVAEKVDKQTWVKDSGSAPGPTGISPLDFPQWTANVADATVVPE